MSKMVTCCVCGVLRPLRETVAVGYALVGWPGQPPVTLYACKGERCEVEGMAEMGQASRRLQVAGSKLKGTGTGPKRAMERVA